MFITNTMRVLKWLRQVREVAMKFNRTILLVGNASSVVPLRSPGIALGTIAIVYYLHRIATILFPTRNANAVCVFDLTRGVPAPGRKKRNYSKLRYYFGAIPRLNDDSEAEPCIIF